MLARVVLCDVNEVVHYGDWEEASGNNIDNFNNVMKRWDKMTYLEVLLKNRVVQFNPANVVWCYIEVQD